MEKGGVNNINDIKKKWMEDSGEFTTMTNNSYDDIEVDLILKALKTGDSKIIEELYGNIA